MWSLKVVKGADLADKLVLEVTLPQPLQRFVIGRDPAAHWTIADRTLAISGRHCEIVDTPAGPALRDLSTNGTFVNGSQQRLSGDHLLRDGDCIELGPFDIQVAGPPMPARPVVAAAPASLPRSPGVMDTAPQRGGDPAAMLALGGGHERVGLTEILRVAAPSEDSGVDLTRIRMAPPPAARKAAPAPSPAPVQAAVPPPVADASLAKTAAPMVSADPLAQALARGLGVPAQALEGQNLLQLVEQLAASARLAHEALRAVGPSNPGSATPK
jgi:type VI secretion system protein ImpI